MGDERSVPKANTQYLGHSHDELKNWTDTGQPGDANGLADTWREMGNGLTEAAENLMVAVFGSQAGWTGKAADAMRGHLQKVAEWSQKTGDSFNKASEAFVTQGESVGTAKTSMPEPVKYDPGQMIKDAASSGNPVQIALLPYNMYKQSQASQEAHAQAAQVVAKRDAELAAAAASIPPFEPPPALGGDKPKEPEPGTPGMPGGGAPGSYRPPVPGAGGAGRGGGGGGGGGVPGFPGGAIPGAGFGPNDPNNQEGDDQNQTPPNVNMPSLPIGSGGGTGTSGYAPGAPTGFGGGGPGGGGGIPGGAGAAGGGGGFGGAFGGGFGPGGAPRPGGGFGPMGPGAAAGGGAGPTAPGGVGAAGRGGMAGGRGAGGMGAGGMGAGRGEGGEDGEHQRPSYLVEPDPDATFGTDQMTAPPVIGG